MAPRDRARLALIRATEQALDRYPERTVAVVRGRLEKAAQRRDGEPLASRHVVSWLAVRTIDVHPAVGERLVRLWLGRAAQKHRSLLEGAAAAQGDEAQPRRGWTR